jgi:hypothetical protein
MDRFDYLNVVRNWFDLRLSQQREIAASLDLPPQGASSQLDWGKLVLATAKERGELPIVAERIAGLISDGRPSRQQGK